ncbi:MAG: glycogen debranching protein GlgX [Candidatus Nanopelagicales bacterium]|nr:glycogen debranching protein GlgX [Candidatus Nanopelagicales bacterium]
MHGAVEGVTGPAGDGPASVREVTRGYERLPDAWPGTWDPLGVTLDANGANVAIWAEGAQAVDLCLFDDDGAERRIALRETTFHVFHGYVPGMRAGDRYGFRVHGPWDPWRGDRWNAAKLLIDPYARAIDGPYVPHPATRGHVGNDDTVRDDQDSAAYVPRCVVVGDDGFDWRGDTRPNIPWTETVIYEAHVKGFTMRHPGIPEHLRGTYAGMAHPAAIEHLQRLGVTAVELLPIHHFISEDHVLAHGLVNYWGYNTLGFFAPHAAYSASGTRGEQVTEFKAMVRALHAAGLEVILDVVYNHTAEGNEKGPTLSFRGIDNHGYYRLSNGRQYADYTGCGNTPDASQPHVLQLIMDSLRYWVTEMHVDGFRFDLASALARSFHDVDMLGSFMSTIQQDPVLRTVKLIAEPWDIGAGGYQVGEFPPLWTEWNDKYRDCVRDYWRGFGSLSELGWRLTGSADLYASEGRRPFASINYVTAHDGFTMRDLVSYSHKHNQANREHNRDGTDNNRSWNHGVEGPTDDPDVLALRERQIRNLVTTLLLSTGVPMLTMGDEIGRTQAGNNNAYCQDNEVSWVDWDLAPWQRDLLAFTAGVVHVRRTHQAFKRKYYFDGSAPDAGAPKDLAWLRGDGQEFTEGDWHFSDNRLVGMYLSGDLRMRGARGEPLVDAPFLLVLNGAPHAGTFLLPGQPFGTDYQVVVDTVAGFAGEHGHTRTHGTALPMPPFSAKLLRVVNR